MNAIRNNPIPAAGGSSSAVLLALIAIVPARYQPYALIALGVVLAATTVALAIERHGPIGKAVADGLDAADAALLQSHDKTIEQISAKLQAVSGQVDQLAGQKAPSAADIVPQVVASLLGEQQRQQQVSDLVQGAAAPVAPSQPAAPAQPPAPGV